MTMRAATAGRDGIEVDAHEGYGGNAHPSAADKRVIGDRRQSIGHGGHAPVPADLRDAAGIAPIRRPERPVYVAPVTRLGRRIDRRTRWRRVNARCRAGFGDIEVAVWAERHAA